MNPADLPRPNPADPRTDPSLAGAYNAARAVLVALDWRLRQVEAVPPIPGPPGPQGPAGPAVLAGHVDTIDLLPVDAAAGEAWLVGAELRLYVADGTGGWTDTGTIRGPVGPAGPPGADGADGNANVTVSDQEPAGVPADGDLWFQVTP